MEQQQATKPKKAPQEFKVPQDAQPARCSCGNAFLFWVLTDGGKRMQVDCDPDRGGIKPLRRATPAQRQRYSLSELEAAGREGKGISHFVSCPDRDKHRKR